MAFPGLTPGEALIESHAMVSNAPPEVPGLSLVCLTRELAERHVEALVVMLNRIPLVDHTPDDVLREGKDGEAFIGRWAESVVAMAGDRPVGLLTTHVKPVQEPTYPVRSVYMSGLAVDADREGRGIARAMIARWLESTSRREFVQAHDVGCHSVQTNAAEFNARTQDLYRSFGFETKATKQYDNRTDVVMFRSLS